MILDQFPSTEEFYKTYWGKKPFIVREYIAPETIDTFIDGDTLAGLSLEEEIKSRLITNSKTGDDWKCQHDPFEEGMFSKLGERDWSLLVQNVEQYHPDTAQLLSHFQMSPRWLMDDIMISYSAPGGSVGPHTDSYHTFLVQGIGKREWKISAQRIDDDRYVDNPDMQILKNGFKGETYEVAAGDVIYMPPFFGHESKTIEAAMTFSVGFLGPKLSEILGEYAQYLEENDALNSRFYATDLTQSSAAFSIGAKTQQGIKNDIIQTIQSDNFNTWMARYFSTPTHDDIENIDMREDEITTDSLLEILEDGDTLFRPNHVKFGITEQSDGGYNLAVYGEVIPVPQTLAAFIEKLNLDEEISIDDVPDQKESKVALLDILTALYNKMALSFYGDEE